MKPINHPKMCLWHSFLCAHLIFWASVNNYLLLSPLNQYYLSVSRLFPFFHISNAHSPYLFFGDFSALCGILSYLQSLSVYFACCLFPDAWILSKLAIYLNVLLNAGLVRHFSFSFLVFVFPLFTAPFHISNAHILHTFS